MENFRYSKDVEQFTAEETVETVSCSRQYIVENSLHRNLKTLEKVPTRIKIAKSAI